MERWDMYCQVCNANIYNAMVDWMFLEHYYCPQSIENWGLVKSAYPTREFEIVFENMKIKEVVLDHHGLSDDYRQSLINHIKAKLEHNGTDVHICDRLSRGMSVTSIELAHNTVFKDFVFKDGAFAPRRQRSQDRFMFFADMQDNDRVLPASLCGKITWYEYEKKGEYYQAAGLIRHITHKRNGRNVLDYNICPVCAKKLDYKCDLCKRELTISKHR